MKTTAAALLLCVTLAQPWAKAKDESVKGRELENKGDKLLNSQKYRDALRTYQKALELYNQAEEFGQQVYKSGMFRNMANCYALTGNADEAVNYYLKAEAGNGNTDISLENAPLDQKSGRAIDIMEKRLNDCAVCESSLSTWEALGDLYQVLGQNDKAAHAHAELELHRQANAAYHREAKKGGGLGFAGTLAVVSAGLSGGDPPPPPSQDQIESSVAAANAKGWHAKMLVYHKANRPEYVAQVRQEMQNSQ